MHKPSNAFTHYCKADQLGFGLARTSRIDSSRAPRENLDAKPCDKLLIENKCKVFMFVYDSLIPIKESRPMQRMIFPPICYAV